MRYQRYIATYDIECILAPESVNSQNARTRYTQKHCLASVAVSSNVDGFQESKCFVLGVYDNIVKSFLEYLIEISLMKYTLLKEFYEDFIDQIDSSELANEFDSFLQQLPVISFNGRRYDIQVMKEQLINEILLIGSFKFAIKNGGSYMCISMNELKFLDILYFIAPGYNYDRFIKSWGVEQTKGYFPYSYLDSPEKLQSREFPPYITFFSEIKQENVLESEYTRYEELLLDGFDHQTALNKMGIDRTPKTGMEKYDEIRAMFENNNWNIGDYLVYYNKLDVGPFIIALERLMDYYEHRQISVFTDAMSGKYIF